MTIIVAGQYNHAIYAPAFYNAFVELGHNVVKHDFCEYTQPTNNILGRVAKAVEARTNWGGNIRSYNKDLISMVEKYKPEIVFLYRTPFVYPETVKVISKQTTVYSYHNDDPFANTRQRFSNRHYIKSAQYCKLNFVYRKKNVDDFNKIGIDNSRILLPYYLNDSNFHINCNKTNDIAFIGHYENDGRDKVIKLMLDAGIDVKLFGDPVTWKQSPYYSMFEKIFGGEVRGARYNELLNKTKVCLCFYSNLNHDTYTRRSFEIPAVKGVMLSEYTTDMDKMFPENQCALYFKSPEEAVRKAQLLLNDENLLRQLGENAYNQLLKMGGSEIDRIKEILNIYKYD